MLPVPRQRWLLLVMQGPRLIHRQFHLRWETLKLASHHWHCLVNHGQHTAFHLCRKVQERFSLYTCKAFFYREQMADVFRQEMTTFGNRVAFAWLTNLSIDRIARRVVTPARSHCCALPHDVSGCCRQDFHPAPGAGCVRPGEPFSNLRLLRYLPRARDCRRLDGDCRDAFY
jgi:hypothetical protein